MFFLSFQLFPGTLVMEFPEKKKKEEEEEEEVNLWNNIFGERKSS
jgi:hypothetical protein